MVDGPVTIRMRRCFQGPSRGGTSHTAHSQKSRTFAPSGLSGAPTIPGELISQPSRRSDPQSAAPIGVEQAFSQKVGCLIFVQFDEPAFANGLGAMQGFIEPMI
jgi:hypothetical protein